jgi:hypothetical protein
MTYVEQAFFAPAEMEGEAGYQIVAGSEGVRRDDARELAVWSPCQDALHDRGEVCESFSFHPLPSGAHCIARSTPAGWEPDGGTRVHTHCLIVPPRVLARFANNPFAIIQTMTENGLWRNAESPSARLMPLALPGGTAAVDQRLLQELAVDPGAENMAILLQEVCNAVCLALAGSSRPERLMAGLFSCLPQECRLEFSFSTGLKFSPRRPFRLVSLSDDPAERLWVATYPNVEVLDIPADAVGRTIPLDGWAELVSRTLATDHISFLAAQISKQRFDLGLADLPALGLQLLEGLECSRFHATAPAPAQHAHAAHRQFVKSQTATRAARPAVTVTSATGVDPPEVLDKLEHLDDLVYEAILGRAQSLEQLRTVWPKLLDDLGGEKLAESREQYLRYALAIWTQHADQHGVRNPARAIQALEVLCLLFGEPT